MIDSLLVANRGEIAARVIRTAKRLGIKTIAVYSEADENAPHKEAADEAYLIGPPQALKSYLNKEAIIEVARKSGVKAIHPGYGFLAENSSFAGLCEKEGFIFVGPSPSSISSMGDKAKARALMKAAGVPVVPGSEGPVNGEDEAVTVASKIGYPVIIKAVAGGGGIGMQIAKEEKEVKNLFRVCSDRAKMAFGDPATYLERYFEPARHIEVQVLGDNYGNVIHLFERECSIQRRHQKVIEETPSPLFINGKNRELRGSLGEAAVAGAKAVGYRNAGTMEFLVDKDLKFYFLEMNTRLQVEHPVTEMSTGLDLVEEQLRIASGEKLRIRQEDVIHRGSAIECRIYAENPDKNFAPSPGLITDMVIPQGEGIRFDCGVKGGYKVSVFYDPLIGKLVAWGEDRRTAIERMKKALEEIKVMGIITNIPLHLKVLSSEAFASGELSTGFLFKSL